MSKRIQSLPHENEMKEIISEIPEIERDENEVNPNRYTEEEVQRNWVIFSKMDRACYFRGDCIHFIFYCRFV
ncbi:MAG: hypothetical protein ABW185_10680 [Sedimenticola sp.]